MAQVKIENLSKSFGAVDVLRGIDIDIKDGEFVALVGPSGCGKSTLLRCLAGLEEITGGSIAINGRDVGHLPPKARNIAMVFQNYALYPHMNVAQNMGFSLKLAGTPQAEIDARVREVAEILGLEALLERRPKQLSGGQRQRVAMGRSIVRNPDVFLFDEPLSNLDAKLRVQMRTEIRRLHQRLGTTTVYVTHDQVEAMTMADRIVVLRDGVIEQVGSPLELYDNPTNAFVAGFIGSPPMNLIKGDIANGVFRSANGLVIDVPGSASRPGVTLGIRPKHITQKPGGLAAVVDVVEHSGNESFCMVSVGDTALSMLSHDRLMLTPGQNITIGLDPEKLHVF